MTENALLVEGERFIAAPPEKIFDILADPGRHAEIDGSGSVQHPLPGTPERLSLGAKFGMAMKIGAPYKINNEVVEFEEGRRIAWRHFGKHEWRYVLEAVEGGTMVRESVDYSLAKSKLVIKLLRYPSRSKQAIDKTLERLEQVATTGSAS